MHLNINKVRRGDKVYRYARLVESYRRKKDGKPTIRVVANLGKLSDREIENFRLALEASRTGSTLVLADTIENNAKTKGETNTVSPGQTHTSSLLSKRCASNTSSRIPRG